ncbi:MAG TPA: I78 family peptidase inhibitor, partial [Croceibacterium sp.]|nr:I78 family peptidase inhibitor [Croceibacterium sp.]
GALALSACATTGEGGGLAGECKAEPAQSFVGQKATPELGARLLRVTGAKQLRWGPPRSAMTMDFRADRLTVSYDDNYKIERISCG